jgi:hypothetical protein
LDFGVTEQRTHDHKRHGPTNLFAALDVGSGQVTAECHPRRTGVEFLTFLRAWLAANPNVSFHFTPVGSSRLNMIEDHD